MNCYHGDNLVFQGRRETKAVVYTYGGAECSITVNSATTAQDVRPHRAHTTPRQSHLCPSSSLPFIFQVVSKLMLGLGIRNSRNRFGLFEVSGDMSKVIPDRALVADILAKFEQYKEQATPGEAPQKWVLFFKIFCFTDVSSVPLDSLEGTIMFEQVRDARGRPWAATGTHSFSSLGM